jgi:large subunit ribosomal protein L6
MSRIARKPIQIPGGVEFKLNGQHLMVKGKKGEFSCTLDKAVNVETDGKLVHIKAKKARHPMVGTTTKMIANMIHGVSEGFERKLQLVGVGYRAKVQGNILELSLGFSNPVQYTVPKGITVEVPTNTEIVIKGADPQVVGEIAAKIRAVRPPEPYKGKGVRYANEVVVIKETKKK